MASMGVDGTIMVHWCIWRASKRLSGRPLHCRMLTVSEFLAIQIVRI